MIRKLRLKFILITMGVLVLVFVALFTTLNIFMRQSSERQTGRLLQAVAEQDGLFFPSQTDRPQMEPPHGSPFKPSGEMMRTVRCFYVKASEKGNFFEANFDMMFDFTQEKALNYARSILEKDRESGTIDNLQYLVVKKDYGKIIVVAERSIETQLLAQLIYVSAWIAGGTFVVLLVFSLFLSKWAVKPVAETFEKQRRFVSDASHELKTPLTIISANVDVLENEIGPHTQLAYIKAQSERMGALIRNLLTLAKTDENSAKIVLREFDLSKVTLNTALEFESRAFEEKKLFSYEVENGLLYVGNEMQIKQLAAILIDNAIRYSSPAGKIKVTLKKSGGRICLSVYNEGMGILESEKEKIFDRFYRCDDSRSRETGGYGLGLAIAKSIAEAHKGKIKVDGEEGKWVEFTAVLN